MAKTIGINFRKLKSTTRAKTNYAVKTEKLIKGSCEVCGTNENIHAHHEDYTKPLQIKWLCSPHHTEAHKKMLSPNQQKLLYIIQVLGGSVSYSKLHDAFEYQSMNKYDLIRRNVKSLEEKGLVAISVIDGESEIKTI